MTLSEPILKAVKPVFDALPISQAMSSLVVTGPAADWIIAIVQQVVRDPAIAERPALCAGLWLYVDELDRSHALSQGIHDATGSFWHGIMHRREGDFSNSHYWFNRAGRHPAMGDIAGYDPHAFIDRVETCYPNAPADLVALQSSEWSALFTWCALH